MALTPPNLTSIHRPFDVLHARLGNGSLGEANLVIQYPFVADGSQPREVFVTTPYPLRVGSKAVFGATFANGGEKTLVKQVDIEVPGGYDLLNHRGQGAAIFGGIAADLAHQGDGEWRPVSGKHLQWRGNRIVEAGTATSWFIEVDVTDDPDQATSVESPWSNGVRSTLAFPNGYVDVTDRWGSSPGILRHWVPASSNGTAADGYPWDATAGTERSFVSYVNTSMAPLSKTASYSIVPTGEDAVRLQNAVANSTLRVSSRLAPVGSVVRVDANMESVANAFAQRGASSVQLDVELWAPPNLGCPRPTASWHIDSGSLPVARAVALEVWPAEGVEPALFVASEDGRVTRVDATGAPRWSTRFEHAPTRMAIANVSLAQPAVLVGDDHGTLHRVHATTGVVLWSARLVEAASPLDAVVSLDANEATGDALVATRSGVIARVSLADGAVLASGSLPGAEEAARSGAAVFVRSPLGLTRLDGSTLQHTGSFLAEGGSGMTVGATRVAFSVLDRTLLIDAETLVTVSAISHSGKVLRTAGGDLHGVLHHVVALRDLSLVAIDVGAGRVSWTYQPEPYRSPHVDPLGISPLLHEARVVDKVVCPTSTYQESTDCRRVTIATSSQDRSLVLRVTEAGIVHSYTWDGWPFVDLIEPDGAQSWNRSFSARRQPMGAAGGPWIGPEAIALGLVDGGVELRHAGEGGVVGSATPTQFAGRFSFLMQVPEGGFYGTHLVKATLSYADETGEPRSATLTEWFEVVRKDGTPVTSPTYDIVLVAREP